MIYSVYWGQTAPFNISKWNPDQVPGYTVGQKVDPRATLAEFIKTSEDDSFVFVLVKKQGQHRQFQEWVEEHKLKDYLQVETASGITNPVHPNEKYNLVFAIMQSANHFQRKEIANEAA